MSSLDQAFIRAYQAGSKSQKRTTPASRAQIPPPAETTRAAATAAPPTGTIPPSAATASEPAMRHYVDSAHPALRGPLHTAIPVYAESAVSLSAAQPLHPLMATVQDAFRPAFETQRFAWPRQVEVLVAAAGSEFAQFITELEERIRTGRQTLVITGCERGEGRTTLTLALARLLALRGLRTVVVDFDLRAPQLAEMLGVRPELGWDDAYAERLPATDAMIESLEDRMTLLPMRNGLANPRAMAGNRMLADIVDQLRAHYDAVLLDAGPLPDDQQAIDLTAALTGAKLDDALVVRDRRRTGAKEVQGVCRRLSALGIHHWDIAENFTELQGY